MKKYKLKKWYPSLRNNLKEGDFVEKKSTSEVYSKGGFTISVEEVENNPTFWQKVFRVFTEEGDELKENDTCFAVIEDFLVEDFILLTDDFDDTSKLKLFSVRKNAEQYVLENKKCLSLNDIYKVLSKESPLAQLIREVVEQKLND